MHDAPKRRVGLFRNVFLHYSETFIHDELRHHRRYDATVFTRQLKNSNLFEGMGTDYDVKYVEKLPNDRRRFSSLWYGLTAQNAQFRRVMKQQSFDILHAHFGHNGLYALPYARKAGLPLVVSLHGRDVTILLGTDRFLPEYWKYLFGYRTLFREADLFLAASTELKTLIEQVGCPKDKVVVNTLGIDLQRFHPNDADVPSDAERPMVLMVGRFVEKKGHAYAIAAAAKAREFGCEFELLFAGEGPLRAACEKQVDELSLTNQVRFLGACSHDEIQRLMTRAQVVMAPSVVAKNLDRESGIIVLKEAAASGVATLGTFHGGIPDIIGDEVTGFIVPERDSNALGERLIRLLNDGALRKRMGQAARQKMEREYNIVKRVAHLETLYDEVIDRHRHRQGKGRR